jgi:hypothetical protein
MTKRKTALWTALLIVPLVAFAAGCSGSSDGGVLGGSGNVRLVLTTDGAAAAKLDTSATDKHGGGGEPWIVGAEVVLTDIEARSSTQQQLVDVGIDLPATVDLFALAENGGTFDLGIGSLPPDSYDQIIVVISSLALTARDGTRITIEPPGGGWTAQVRTDPFEVIDGETTTIQIRFRMDSFRFGLNDDLGDIDAGDFHPGIDCHVGGGD